MPPSIHPVDLITALRHKHLTPAIVFLTSRRACDEAMETFDHADLVLLPHDKKRSQSLWNGSRFSTPALPSTR